VLTVCASLFVTGVEQHRDAAESAAQHTRAKIFASMNQALPHCVPARAEWMLPTGSLN